MVTLNHVADIAAAAQSYLAAGLCVLPARLDKKYPLLSTWKEFQSRLPSAAEVDAWLGEMPTQAMCILSGAISGDLEMIDFDCQAEVFDDWCELVEAEAPGLLARLVIERSQGLGKHVAYRLEAAVPGSVKLAEHLLITSGPEPVLYKGKTYIPRKVGDHYECYPTLVETRGQGGLFLCAPSPGYVLEQGSFENLPLLTVQEREILIRCAASFNRNVKMASQPMVAESPCGRPGDKFNERGDIRDLLVKHGWTLARPGDNEYWCRPGKDSSWGATYNGQVFYVFTSSAPPFEPARGYSRFQVYAMLDHNGDYSAAASALRAQGYGEAGVGSQGVVTSAIDVMKPSFLTVRQLLAGHPDLRSPVIHGLLRQGETMNIIAPPKTGKSWLTIDLAMSVATGKPWLGLFPTERGDVLIIDNELHGETTANRIPRVAEARGIELNEIADALCVENLRGRLRDLMSLGPYFEQLQAGRFKVIVLDAFYRFLPKDTDENDNGSVAQLYNLLDRWALKLGCCFVLIHHASKGNQSAKSVTDVGAGAGSQSRATDTHLVLRAHEEDKAVVLDAAVRSWPPVEPICLRWDFPAFYIARDLDPNALRPERPRRKAKDPVAELPLQPECPWDTERFTREFVTDEFRPRAVILEAAERAGLSERRAETLLKRSVETKRAYQWRSAQNEALKYATVQPPLLDVDEDRPREFSRNGRRR